MHLRFVVKKTELVMQMYCFWPYAAFGYSTVADFDLGKRIDWWGSGEWITCKMENQSCVVPLKTSHPCFLWKEPTKEKPSAPCVCARARSYQQGAGLGAERPSAESGWMEHKINITYLVSSRSPSILFSSLLYACMLCIFQYVNNM